MGQLPPIAIVGVSCRMPGGDGIADYWKLIESGSSAIGQLPDERLNRSLYFDAEQGKVGRSYTELGGIVPDRPVNRSVCPISDELLAKSDVAHLNLCEVASAALQHAGMDPKNVPYARTGVFVGHSGGSCLGGDAAFTRYAGVTGEILKRHEEFKGCSPAARADLARRMVDGLRAQLPEEKTLKPMNFAAANAAMLISRVHGFEGPSLVIDAACASSLMALSQAAQSLARGEIDMAVAGGASYSKWFGLVLFSMAMSISPTGSRPFDSDADGLISSDGYGIVILKTLSRAIADGDRILSVIRGIGVSSDGRGKSLWAPRPEGQMLAVERAYSKDVTPASLQYIECHATSTQVGDATELKTLSHVFANMIPAGRKIPIGSVKANIGHTLEAAGIAGLIKTVLAMDKGIIPPQINFKTPNPQIDWDNIPFEVATQSRQWDRPGNGMPRRAAVNSFGIGGLNVHMVLDDGLLPGESGKTQVSIPSKVSGAVSRSSKSAQTKQQPIAIIGTSAILPGALTKAAMWEVLVSGKDPKCEFPKSRCSEVNVLLAEQQAAQNPEQTTRGGYISDFVYDWKRHKVPPKQIANANPLQFMLLDAADQALEDAGYGKRTFDRTMAAVVVGTMFGGDFAVQLQLGLRVPHIQQMLRELLIEDGVAPNAVEEAVVQFEKRLFKVMPALLDETGSFTSSTLASRLSKSFDFCGGAFSIESDEVSGLVALNAGIGMLDTGAADMVLCAAGHQSMSYNSFEKLLECDLLSRGDSRSGFDAAFDGVLPAEGVAVVVLKRLADAERDGDPIRAIIRGTAQCTNKGEESATFHRAFREACEVAGTSPEDIGLLESAGIESPSRIPDNAEIVLNVQNASGEQTVCISSLTPQFGYLRGAAGVASVVKAVLEIEHATIPPVYGLQNLNEMAQPTASAIPREKQPLFATMPDGHAQIAVNNTSEEGFGFSIILESRAELPKRPVAKSPEIATKPAAAPTRPKVASAGVSTPRPVRNRLALAFPGQGSYYAGMGSQLLEDYPVARERLAEFNRALRLEGCPEFETLAADPGSSILNAQLSMLVIDLLYYAVYQTSSVKPDFVCGHSYGEFPALVAAGALTFQNAVRATKQRSAVVEEFGGKQGGLLAISSDAATIRQLLTRSTIEVFLANINSPEQTVVGGTPEDLRQFEQMLKAKRIGSRMLKVPAAYHTPLLEPALATYRDCIRDLPITPPHIPVISGIGNCLVLDPEVIRENLVMQLVSPMDFVGMIEVLQQQNVGTVVEVGPRKVLAQLIQRTVSETELRCLPMDPRDASSPEWSSTLLATRKAVETTPPKPPAPTIPPRTKTPVAQAATVIPPTAKDAGSVVTEKSRIIHFDATARRKEQNRERALKQRAEAGKPEIGVAASQEVSAPVPERNGHAVSNGHAANGRAEANGWHAPPAPTPAAEPVVAPVAEPVVAVVEAPAA
ncbi:MAG: hypothetical protein C0478_16050, partial [Planctomyces sp.]|nr:hypothetical protein [Planctomyces sp.]